jgi:hypothetical protein
MNEKDFENVDIENNPSGLSDEPQGWCSPEFPSGCILDTDWK